MTNKAIDIEGQIRKDSHRNYFFRVLDEDIAKIIKPHEESFLYVNCPNCNSKKTHKDFDKGQFSYYRCSQCDMLYVNPRPPISLIDEFYRRSKAVRASTQSLIDNEDGRTKYIFIPRAEQILSCLKEFKLIKGKMLEVGCSIGSFLSVMKNMSSFEVEGIDPSDLAYNKTTEKGIKVHKATLEEFDFKGKKFDVILNFETIEHIFSPVLFLKKINSLMPQGGILVLTTPNLHGFDMMTLGRFYKNIHAPCHLNYFNVDTIDHVLDRAGFSAEKKMTPGILDLTIVRKQVQEGVAPEISPFLKHLVFHEDIEVQGNFQRFLQDNRLSGNMLVYAKKVKEKPSK